MDKLNISQTEQKNQNAKQDDELESKEVPVEKADQEKNHVGDEAGYVEKELITDQTLIHKSKNNTDRDSKTKTFVKDDHRDADAETKKFSAIELNQVNDSISTQDDEDSEQPTTRQLRRQKKKQKRKEKVPVRRIFPIWLRIIVIFLLSLLALIIGMIIGYSMLGDGEPFEVLTFEFWKRVFDYITGVE